MNQDFPTFCKELDNRLSQLMASFRILQADSGSKAEMQSFFKELFSLQAWFQQSRERVSAPSAGEDKERYFELLYKSSLILNGSLEEPRLLELALDTVLEMCNCVRGFIATVDEVGELSFVTARHFELGNIPESERDVSTTVIKRAMDLQKEQSVDRGDFDNSLLQQSSIMRREGSALICVPVIIDHEVKAVIYLDQFRATLSLSVFNLARQFAAQLGAFLKNAEAFASLRAGREQLLASLKKNYKFDKIIGKNPVMLHLLKTVAKVAPTEAPVLVQGETGTGKELIARAVHENSARSGGPFIEVDCGALPANLIESELFGHGKGAFTGSSGERTGLLEAARGGSLFLDEINNLPLDLQTRFLRALQHRKIRRVGETAERLVDFRLIAASSRDLKELVGDGAFRQDLYYRMNTVAVSLPPLREGKDDLFSLAISFLERFTKLYDRPPLTLEPQVMTALENHHWAGNVRELEHVIERAVILCEGGRITLTDLPFEFHGMDPWTEEQEKVESLEDYVNKTKKYYISKVLRENEGNKAEAARRLKVNRSYFFQLLKQLEINE